jgi:hypothetical protein
MKQKMEKAAKNPEFEKKKRTEGILHIFSFEWNILIIFFTIFEPFAIQLSVVRFLRL